MTDFDDRYSIDRLTAEFVHADTEARFRDYIRAARIRDTRLTIALAAVLYMAFAITDYLILGPVSEYLDALFSRLAVCGVGLTGAVLLGRYPRWLLNGAIPTAVVTAAMIDFMFISAWVPYDIVNRGMAMMVMLYGVFVFIPNRFLPSLVLALISTLAFLVIVDWRYAISMSAFGTLVGHLLVTILMAAMIAYRLSRLIREEYRDHAMVSAANQRLQVEMQERQRLEDILRQRANTDDTTGIANRAAFFDTAEPLLGRAQASGKPLSVLMFDIDYYRQLRGTYGHVRCDEVLKALVSVCRAKLGQDGYLARLGAEEFVVILPDHEVGSAREIAERIRAECQRTPVAIADVFIHFTISIGVTQYQPLESVNHMLRRCDEAISAAKYNGRNRVEVAAV